MGNASQGPEKWWVTHPALDQATRVRRFVLSPSSNFNRDIKLRRPTRGIPTLQGKPWTILETGNWFYDAIHVKQDEFILHAAMLA